MLPERPRRIRRVRPSTLCFDERSELLRKRFHAHKPEHGSSDRVVLVIEFYEAEMIRALEHVLVNFLCSRRAKRIGEPPCVHSEAGEIRKCGHDQKTRRVTPRMMYRGSAFENRRVAAECFLDGESLVVRHGPCRRKIVKPAERNHASNRVYGKFFLNQITLVESQKRR